MAKIKLSRDEFNGLCSFARSNLLGYACLMYNQYAPATHHELMADALEKVERGALNRLIISMPPRHGKLCVDSTAVLTTKGWKTHGEVVEGDYVYHPSGTPVKVVAVSDKTLGNVEVEFTNKQVVKCHENHEWTLYDRARGVYVTLETKELFNRQLRVGPEGRGGRYVLQLPDVSPLDNVAAQLPIHPYTLGVWLGDGKSDSGTYCCAKEDTLNDFLVECGETLSEPRTHKTTGVLYQTIYGIRPFLRKLDLINNKHIPDVYYTGSKEQRMDLLAGLIDTDGCVDSDTGRVRIVSCSRTLVDDIAKLVATFGWRATVSTQEPAESSSGIVGKQSVYTVSFNNDEKIPVRLYRKWKNQRDSYKKRKVAVKSVKYTGTPEQGHCIQVDAEDGLYLVTESLIPTHNSMLTSEFFPSWYLGRNPEKQVIVASATSDYAGDIGAKIRNHMTDDLYQYVFPGVTLRKDSQAKDKFNTSRGGTVLARGVGGQIVGRGAHLLVIDDPIKSWQEADSPSTRKTLKEWYSGTAYHRLMPGNSAIIVIATRWHEDDLTGWLLSEHSHENWTELKLPAIDSFGDALWPEAYPIKDLERIKQTLTRREWTALYQQEPADDEGNILKRDHWKLWPKNKPFPRIEYTLQSYDTAFSDRDIDTNSKSARTTWGVFKREDGTRGVMLLEAWSDRVDYPTLKQNFLDAYKKWKPDRSIIEKKASGQSLIQDLKRSGIYVTPYQPDRDKVARAYSIQALFEGGLIYYPDRDWARDVIEECAKFPTGKTDDYVDTVTQALIFFRASSMLELVDDWSGFDKKAVEAAIEEEDEDGKVVYIGNWKTKKKKRMPAYG